MNVTRSRSGRLGSARASSTTITVPPMLSGEKISMTDGSKLTEVQNSTPESTSRYASAAHSTMRTAVSCSTATPLGRPVEPEV
jgi:hypothetical protein